MALTAMEVFERTVYDTSQELIQRKRSKFLTVIQKVQLY